MMNGLQIEVSRMAVRKLVERLTGPSLGDVLYHPERWRIVRITNHGIDVVEIKPEELRV